MKHLTFRKVVSPPNWPWGPKLASWNPSAQGYGKVFYSIQQYLKGPLGPAQFRGTLILSSKVFYSIQQYLKFL